mgnify:CR=1 FL=1
MKKTISIIVIFITLLAFGLRVYRLNLNAPSLYADEVGGHYHSWVKLTLSSSSLINRIYNSLFLGSFSFIWLLGLTPLGVRMPAAIFGTVLVFCLYLFAKSINLGKKDKIRLVALVTLALGAFLPWAFHISRIGNTAIPIFLIAVCVHLTVYLRASNARGYFLSLLPLLVATYFYPSMLVITPVIIIMVLGQIFRFVSKNQLRAIIPILFVISIFFLTFILFRVSSRAFDLAIWKDVNVTADANVYRGLARLSQPTIFSFNQDPELLANSLVYNYPLSVINVFIRNYLSFFSPDVLFLKGDPVLRHSTGQVGAFFPFLIPFMIYGAFLLFKSNKRKIKQMFLVWILISPIPAALTKDGFGYLPRAITMMPFLTYLSAFGLVESINLIKPRFKPLYLLAIAGVGFYFVYYFLFAYFHVYPARAAKSYEFGFKELSDFQIEQESKPMLVVWDGYYPHFHFRFWQATDAKEYSLFTPTDVKINQSVFHKMYPNLYFSFPQSETDLREFTEKNNISFIVFPSELFEKYSQYILLEHPSFETVFYPDQTPAFYIYQIDKVSNN